MNAVRNLVAAEEERQRATQSARSSASQEPKPDAAVSDPPGDNEYALPGNQRMEQHSPMHLDCDEEAAELLLGLDKTIDSMHGVSDSEEDVQYVPDDEFDSDFEILNHVAEPRSGSGPTRPDTPIVLLDDEEEDESQRQQPSTGGYF